MDEIKKLEGLKKKFDAAKTDIATLRGRLQSVEETMEKEFEVKTVKEAKSILSEISAEIDSHEKSIESKWNKLEKRIPDWAKE